jgi:hypothetical protein
MYEYIGVLLGARPILHISRIKVKGIILLSWIKGGVRSGIRRKWIENRKMKFDNIIAR